MRSRTLLASALLLLPVAASRPGPSIGAGAADDPVAVRLVRPQGAPVRSGQSGLVAVALSAHDSVTFLDPGSLERVATLPVGPQPHELTAAGDGRTLYVADAGGSTVTVLDVSARPRVAATWPMPDGTGVHDVAVAADGTVWAASGSPSVVFGLDAADGSVLRRHALHRDGSWMLDARGPGGALVVASLEGGAVTLLDPVTGREVVLEGEEGEIDAQATPDGREIWSVNSRVGTLTVFDAVSGRRVRRVESGAGAGRIVFTPDGSEAVVVHGAEGSVAAYDVATGDERGRVDVGDDPKVIALSPDGRRAWISHPRGALTLLDVPSLRVLRAIVLAGTPDGVAFLPAAGR